MWGGHCSLAVKWHVSVGQSQFVATAGAPHVSHSLPDEGSFGISAQVPGQTPPASHSCTQMNVLAIPGLNLVGKYPSIPALLPLNVSLISPFPLLYKKSPKERLPGLRNYRITTWWQQRTIKPPTGGSFWPRVTLVLNGESTRAPGHVSAGCLGLAVSVSLLLSVVEQASDWGECRLGFQFQDCHCLWT